MALKNFRTSSLFYQHINLDCLNFHLAEYELELEAFAAFRARQLQASRAQITDSAHLLPEMGQMGGASTFLEDLHLVSLRVHSRCAKQCCQDSCALKEVAMEYSAYEVPNWPSSLLSTDHWLHPYMYAA